MPRCTTKSHNTCKLPSSHLAHALDANPGNPSPESHGWLIGDGQVDINWMSLLPAPDTLLELLLCMNVVLHSTMNANGGTEN